MTAPNEAPATGAETGTSTTSEPAETTDWKAEAEKLAAERDEWKGHARKHEQALKNERARTAKPADTKPEPGDDSRVKQAQAAADEARFEAHLVRLAAGHSAEALDLLNRIDFREEVDELDFETQAELRDKFLKLVEKRLGAKRSKPVESTSGGEFAGGSGATQPITEAQLKTMTPAQVAEAYKAGKLQHLL